MTSSLKLSDHVRQAGSDIASNLINAQVRYSMGGLGGCKHFDLDDFPEQNRDLILAYINDEIDSVEAIFHAMSRAMIHNQRPSVWMPEETDERD